jgi:hypothetical protein
MASIHRNGREKEGKMYFSKPRVFNLKKKLTLKMYIENLRS